jgi:DNA mismatch repair protein MutS2
MTPPQDAAFAVAAAKLEFDRVRARVIHFASSDPGRAILEELFPSAHLPGIREELARVTEMKALVEQEGTLPLDGIFAVGPALHRSGLEGPPLQPRDLLQIGGLLRASRTVKAFVQARRAAAPLLSDLTADLAADRVLEFNIDQAIDETEAVKATASRELQSIRRAIADRYESLRKRLQGILRQLSTGGISQEEIITTREGRMVLPVKTEFKNQVPGFIHSASASGATVFIEPADTLDLNNGRWSGFCARLRSRWPRSANRFAPRWMCSPPWTPSRPGPGTPSKSSDGSP